MRDTSETSDSRVGRRTLLGLLGSAAVGSLVGSGRGAASEPPFVLEQAGRCVPLQPLGAGVGVEEFYDYRAPFTEPSAPGYSSYGTVDLQRPETSILFLYEGPRGTSLVVVHDKLEDGTPGGSASLAVAGHPPDGEWFVRDDDYEGQTSYDVWDVGETESRIDWTWGAGRSDGGIFGPLDATTELTITPRFNEQAALAGQFYDGEITEWQVLSGSIESPERTALDLTEPVVIHAGTCGDATARRTTRQPTKRPTRQPTKRPTQPEPAPTKTSKPTKQPTQQPTTEKPTRQPTTQPPPATPRDDDREEERRERKEEREEEKREREEERRERREEREEEKREREEERRERKEEREEERRERKEEKEEEDDD